MYKGSELAGAPLYNPERSLRVFVIRDPGEPVCLIYYRGTVRAAAVSIDLILFFLFFLT